MTRASDNGGSARVSGFTCKSIPKLASWAPHRSSAAAEARYRVSEESACFIWRSLCRCLRLLVHRSSGLTFHVRNGCFTASPVLPRTDLLMDPPVGDDMSKDYVPLTTIPLWKYKLSQEPYSHMFHAKCDRLNFIRTLNRDLTRRNIRLHSILNYRL